MDQTEEPAALRRRVLAAIDLPAIAPSVDRTASSVARRVGVDVEEVEEALKEMARGRPPIVREVRGRGDSSTWVVLRPAGPPTACGF